jgi:hypothetical protein
MKRAMLAAALLVAMPASAQPGATELEVMGRGLINSWIEAYNRADVGAMMTSVYAEGDRAKLTAMFVDLQNDSFGKLDAYGADFCNVSAKKGRALLTFARIYSFGGKMNDDEAIIFELVKTDRGWRIADEADAPVGTVLSCL